MPVMIIDSFMISMTIGIIVMIGMIMMPIGIDTIMIIDVIGGGEDDHDHHDD